MKIKINGRVVVKDQSPERKKMENGFRNLMLDTIRTDVAILSGQRLRQLQLRMQQAAAHEAMGILDQVDQVIGTTSRSPLSGAKMLGSGAGLNLKGISPSALYGGVNWAPLRFSYGKWKDKHRRQSAGGFFIFNNRLRPYFRHRGRSLIDGKFGGVKIKVDEQGFHSRLTKPIWRTDDRAAGRELKDVIGKIDVQIFPNINASLLPMLSANRWNTNLKPDFERQTFAGTLIGYKLTNPRGPYRPLFLPILQFFMMVRIPGAIKYQLDRFLNLSSIKG